MPPPSTTAIGLKAATHLVTNMPAVAPAPAPGLDTNPHSDRKKAKADNQENSENDWSSVEFAEMKKRSEMAVVEKKAAAQQQVALTASLAKGTNEETPNKKPQKSAASKISPKATGNASVSIDKENTSFSGSANRGSGEKPLFMVGEMVEVARRKMPGFNFDGGAAIVKKVNDEASNEKMLKDGSSGGIRTTRYDRLALFFLF